MTTRFAPARRSVRFRLTLWNVGIVALILALFTLITDTAIQRVLMAGLDHDLEARSGPRVFPPELVRNAARGFRAAALKAPRSSRPRRFDFRLERDRSFYVPCVILPSGQVLFPGDRTAPWDSGAFRKALQGKAVYSTAVSGGMRLRLYSRPMAVDGKVVAVLQLAHPLVDVERAIAGTRRTLLELMPLALLLAAVAGFALTDRGLRPVRQIVDSAQRLGAHDLAQRLPETGADEFANLARSFNGVLARLEIAFRRQQEALEQQSRFTADASHELKTPLTVVKVNAGLLLNESELSPSVRGPVEDIDRAAQNMNRLVQDLLLLARFDAGQHAGACTDLPVEGILHEARSALGAPARQRVNLAGVDAELTVYGNEEELVRVFVNLLDNAIRYSEHSAAVRVHASRTVRAVHVEVSDAGPGIAESHLGHLGERFYRVDNARSRSDGGTGLGLAICKSIVESYNGSLLFASRPGIGTSVTVVLPSRDGAEESGEEGPLHASNQYPARQHASA